VIRNVDILVADDDETSARFLKRLLSREGHNISIVDSVELALRACEVQAPDLVLVDLVAPRGQGFELCRRLKNMSVTKFVPVVIVTALSDRTDRLRGIEAGCDDFLVKPFDATELHARIQSLVRIKRFTDDLESAEAVIMGMGATIEARDPSTNGHCQRLAHYATRLGRSLNLDESDLGALERGGFLHDIGKIAVPDSVLLKKGQLDPHESRVMQKHPIIGDGLCSGLRSLIKVRPIVRHHHERLDGTGYPDGLRNREVPLLAQIVGVVDVFDALTTERPYRAALPPEDAFQVLTDESAKGWRDRVLVDAFVNAVAASPS
jgi:putative two-component system response regulator